MKYTYAMRNRPAMYGTCPSGFANEQPHKQYHHGTIQYDHPLTAEDLYRYEMVLIDPLPSLPLYPVGSKVKELRNGKIWEIELIDGEYFAGDFVLPLTSDHVWKWYQFAPVSSIEVK